MPWHLARIRGIADLPWSRSGWGIRCDQLRSDHVPWRRSPARPQPESPRSPKVCVFSPTHRRQPLSIGGHGIHEGRIAADVEDLAPAYGRFYRVGRASSSSACRAVGAKDAIESYRRGFHPANSRQEIWIRGNIGKARLVARPPPFREKAMSLKRIGLWVVMLTVALICGTAWAEDKTTPAGNPTNRYIGPTKIIVGTLAEDKTTPARPNVSLGIAGRLASGSRTLTIMSGSVTVTTDSEGRTHESPVVYGSSVSSSVVTSNSAVCGPTQNGCQTVNNCRCHCRRWRCHP